MASVTTAPADDVAPAGPPPEPPAPGGGRRRAAWGLLLPLVVVAVAGVLRFDQLGQPERCYFDETYYYYDARDLLERGVEDGFVVHPPVGKWMIAAGLAAFGVDAGSPLDTAVTEEPTGCGVDEDAEPNPAAREREAAEAFGRRAAAAVAGTLSVLLTYLIGLRLFDRPAIAALAAFFLAIDGLALTMSRIAMLDVFLTFWILAGVLCLLVDRDRLWAGAPAAAAAELPHEVPGEWEPPSSEAGQPRRVVVRQVTALLGLVAAIPAWVFFSFNVAGGIALGSVLLGELLARTPLGRGAVGRTAALPPRPRRWLWAAGLCFGLALATKWSALLAIGGAGLFVLGSELAWRHRVTGSPFVGLGRLAARGFLALLLVPLLVYLASYAGWFANIEGTRKADRCEETDCGALDLTIAFWDEQKEIFGFHRDLDADHPYRASAATWPLLLRPVAYYFESCNDPESEDCVVAEGNVEEILGNGNPAIWWMALPAYVVVGWGGLGALLRRRRPAGDAGHAQAAIGDEDRTRRTMAAWLILAFLLAQYLPWLISPRTVFLFYATPLVPFICLALGYAADRALDHPQTRWIPATMTVVAVAGLLFWYPIWVGLEISRPSLDVRLLRRIDFDLLRTPGWL